MHELKGYLSTIIFAKVTLKSNMAENNVYSKLFARQFHLNSNFIVPRGNKYGQNKKILQQ